MNRALPIEKLRGAVFGETLPMAYHALCTQIGRYSTLEDGGGGGGARNEGNVLFNNVLNTFYHALCTQIGR